MSRLGDAAARPDGFGMPTPPAWELNHAASAG